MATSLCSLILLLFVLLSTCRTEYFDPSFSSSYEQVQGHFAEDYVDGAGLYVLVKVGDCASFCAALTGCYHPRNRSGNLGKDIVQLGEYATRTSFGVVSEPPKSEWKHDGVLGLGMINEKDRDIHPPPLFYALTTGSSGEDASSSSSNSKLASRVFSLLLDDEAGELQLGGFVEESVIGPVLYSSVIPDRCDSVSSSSCEYSRYKISVAGLRLGNRPLLNTKSGMSRTIVGVLDSGASCLVLPSASSDNGTSVMEAFESVIQSEEDIRVTQPSIFVAIGKREYEIPWSQYHVAGDSSLNEEGSFCIHPNREAPKLMILGDVFLRSVVTVHNLESDPPSIGLGIRNPSYSAVKSIQMSKSSENLGGGVKGTDTGAERKVMQIPFMVERRSGVVPSSLFSASNEEILLDTESKDTESRRGTSRSVAKLPIVSDRVQYTTILQVGTPRQSLRVMIDTGTSSLVIFANDFLPNWLELFVLMFLGFLVALGVVGLLLLYQKKLQPEEEIAFYHPLDEHELESISCMVEQATSDISAPTMSSVSFVQTPLQAEFLELAARSAERDRRGSGGIPSSGESSVAVSWGEFSNWSETSRNGTGPT